MKKLLILAATIGALSGCASNVTNDVNRYKTEISNSEHNISVLESKITKESEKIRSYRSSISMSNKSIQNSKENIARERIGLKKSRTYLSKNTDVFANGQCIRPRLGPKPRPYCESRSDAKEHALAFCSMSAGCDAAMLLASDELDTFSKRFLASEACSRTVHKLRGEGYSPDTTAVNALEALSDTGCNNQDSGFFAFLGKVGGCLLSAGIKLEKIQSYVNCTENKAEVCYSNYTRWKSEPLKREKECLTNVRNIIEYTNNIPKYEKQIASNKNFILKNTKLMKNSENFIAEATKLLEQEKGKKARYTRLLSEKKRTFAYKLFGG